MWKEWQGGKGAFKKVLGTHSQDKILTVSYCKVELAPYFLQDDAKQMLQ